MTAVDFDHLREQFVLDDRIYLDGNSLGRPCRSSIDAVATALEHEWAVGLIESWDVWIDRSREIGDLIAAHCLGAAAGTTTLSDSTSINLWKLTAAAARHARSLDPNRTALLVDEQDFPTDRYVVDSIAEGYGFEARRFESHPINGPTVGDLDEVLGDDVAVVILSHVNYRSGALADMAALTALCHDAGSLIVWDLSHSVGSVPIDLAGNDVDVAVGCTYKYLNGGPGAPAFFTIAPRLIEAIEPAIAGWFGTRAQFEMRPAFEAVPGIDRFQVGTPPILSATAVGPAVELLGTVGMPALRARSTELTSRLIEGVDAELARFGVEIATPRAAAQRGGHVTLTHPEARQLSVALRMAGVVGDYREPNGLRLAPVPLYTTPDDVDVAIARIASILANRDHLAVDTSSRVT